MTYTLKQLHPRDQPLEKLRMMGKNNLSESELLAILIRSGLRNATALDIARKLLAVFDNDLNRIAQLELGELTKFQGIGPVKAASVLSALELGRRRGIQQQSPRSKITGSQLADRLMRPLIADLQHEEFWIIYLNNAHEVLTKVQLSKGGISATLVDPRLIFKKALQLLSTSIILCHNHPSGNLSPSESDKKLTEKLIAAGKLLDIKVLDHLILGQQGYFSFVDQDML